jgi:uncharacterized protein
MTQLSQAIRNNFIQMSEPAKILILAFLVMFFLFTGTILAAIIALPVFDLNLTALYQILEAPDINNIGIIKYFQVAQSVFLFLLPALIAAWLFSTHTFKFLMADRKASSFTLTMVVLSIFIAIPLMNFLTLWNSMLVLPEWMNGIENKIRAMEDSAGKLTELFLLSNSYRDLFINFSMIAILPAIAEEFFFRGVLQKMFIDWTKNNHLGIFISSALFSFIHFQFYGFIPRLLLGLYFGYLLLWTSSIWVPVIAHLINNGMAVVFYHFSAKPVGETPLDKIGTEQQLHYTLYLSVFFTALIIGLIYMNEKKRRTIII